MKDFFNNLWTNIKSQKITLGFISFFIITISLPIDKIRIIPCKILTILNIEQPHEKIEKIEQYYYNIHAVILILLIIIVIVRVILSYNEVSILMDWKIKNLNTDQIRKLKTIPKVALIGLSNSGKTTFLNRLNHCSPSEIRTQEINGKILAIENEKICFIDISGENYVQQFKAIELADFIIFMVDHSENSESIIIARNRINSTKELLNRIKDHLTANEFNKKIPTIILINKKDLWSKSKKYDELITAYSELQNTIKEIFGDKSEIHQYTNFLNRKTKSEELHKILTFILTELKK